MSTNSKRWVIALALKEINVEGITEKPDNESLICFKVNGELKFVSIKNAFDILDEITGQLRILYDKH